MADLYLGCDIFVQLSRREREILCVLYRLGTSTAAEIRAELRQKPTYSTVRALLSVLENKGRIRHHERDLRYVFSPVVPIEEASVIAARELVTTFFGGSVQRAIETLKTMQYSDQQAKGGN
jgi:predicted transcriptional regulator